MKLDRQRFAAEVKAALSDPTRVLESLGLLGQGRERQRQAAGWLVRCPVHADAKPSCSVQSKAGVLLWKCWACDASGDALSLVAAVNGMSLKRDFRAVLLEAARIGGVWHVVDELEGRETPAPRPVARVRMAQEAPARSYPAPEEVEALWTRCRPADEDQDVASHLFGRGINPVLVDCQGLGRALPDSGPLPSWARCRFGDWREAGYRFVVPMYDAAGTMRSLRAWRVIDGEGPKRLPPTGCKASELVMADMFALAWLRGDRLPERVVIVEGEPDFLTWGVHLNDPSTATIGIVSGSWCEAFAARFPRCRVDIRTDQDQAGDRYAREIEASLRRRCFVHWTRRAS